MNYTELYDAILAETENTDDTFVDSIPTFVQNAEKRIYQAVKLPAMRLNATAFFQINNPYLALPTGYLSAWEVAVISSGEYSYLLPKDVSYIREVFPDPTLTGIPRFYAQFDSDTFIVAPTPEDNLQTELHYFAYPESIVTAATSWLGDNFDNVLLYGSLVEAGAFMKSEEDIMKAYSEQYTVNLKLLKDYANGSLRSGDYRK